jgi:hypothetical protein
MSRKINPVGYALVTPELSLSNKRRQNRLRRERCAMDIRIAIGLPVERSAIKAASMIIGSEFFWVIF